MLKRLVWIVPVGMATVVYFPLTASYFLADDFFHLWQLLNEGLARFVVQMHGGHMCVARNLVFAVFYRLFGTNPAPYFWAVLFTHLFNVYLLFVVVRSLTNSEWIACVTAGAWGIAPVNEGALGWYSVYGHVLVGTCTLWVLARLASVPARASTPWICGAVITVGSTCFGTGVGIALVMPAVAWLLLPKGRVRTTSVAAFGIATISVVALYLVLQHVNAAFYGTPPAGIPLRWSFVTHVFGFFVRLVGYPLVALGFGVFERPGYYPGVVGTVWVAFCALLAAVALWRAPRLTARPLIACLLVMCGAYAMIAVGRAVFVNPATAGWMVTVPRYHYVGAMAAAVMLGVVAGGLTADWRLPAPAKAAALAAWVALAMSAALRFGRPLDHFDKARLETVQTLAAIRAVAQNARPGADVYVRNRPFQSIGVLLVNHMEFFPGWAGVFAIFHPDGMVEGHRVYFIIDDRKTLLAARHGRRASDLLRGAFEVPSG